MMKLHHEPFGTVTNRYVRGPSRGQLHRGTFLFGPDLSGPLVTTLSHPRGSSTNGSCVAPECYAERRHSCSVVWLNQTRSVTNHVTPHQSLQHQTPQHQCQLQLQTQHQQQYSHNNNHKPIIHPTNRTNLVATFNAAAAAGSWIRNFDCVLKRNSAHLSPSSSSVPLENYL
ncbi:hypothetical protein BLOT_005152 [Blomia tropicalis]|nr:hypothetical protein BLOT_005152 [Blomia tropicalis]